MINRIKKIIKTNDTIYKIGVRIYKTLKEIELTTRLFMFKTSSYSRNLKKFKDIHKGKRCFIIGNGPSLDPKDLDKLKNEITFATNRIFNIFNKTTWRPTYYCAQDFVLINQIKNNISKIECVEKFVAINTKWLYNIKFENCRYFYLNMDNYGNEGPKFSNDISRGIYEGFTVTYAAMQIAKYMGFSEIYLLGVDHNYSTVIKSNGEIIIDNKARDYFGNDSNENLNLPNLEKSTLAYISGKLEIEKSGIKIFNSTRGGKLEIFQRVDLDEALK